MRRIGEYTRDSSLKNKSRSAEKVIDWIGSASLTLDQEMHHEKGGKIDRSIGGDDQRYTAKYLK